MLRTVKSLVDSGRFQISVNENRTVIHAFIDTYRLTTERQKVILKSIRTSDYCYSDRNRNPDFPNHWLHVFAPEIVVRNLRDEPELKTMYLKMDLIEKKRRLLLIISFHELNFPIDYAFA